MPKVSSDRGDRLAEYGTRATVHPPRDSPHRRVPLSRTVATGARVVAAAGILLVVVPAVLWLAGGNPLRRLPQWSQIPAWFERSSGRFTPDVLIGAAFWVMWLLWAVFALLLVAELVTTLTRWRIPALTLPAPLHRLVFGLAGTAALAVTSAGSLDAAATPDRPTAPVATAEHIDVPRQAPASGPAIIQVADQRYLYTVERHDTLSKVAKEWLGDANRWPQICQLNKHRHFPGTGGTLRDCDLIYPGWELRLPADARPPHAATPATPTTPPSQAPPRSGPPPASASADPQPSGPTTRPSDTTTETPPASPSSTPGTPTISGTPSAPSPTEPTPTPQQPTTVDPTEPTTTDGHGVRLSATEWLPWSLAAAISAAATMVWLHRRRRYTGEPDSEPLTALPAPVVQVRRAVTAHPSEPGSDEQPPRLHPVLTSPPGGGIGIVGDGAHAAARATLVAVLAAGDPHHPDARSEIIIDTATLTTLLGPDATTLTPWPRLHLVDTLTDALTTIETHLLHRSRILDEHTLTDLDTTPHPETPDAGALPPIVLITEAPPPTARMRTKTALTLGADLHVSALLLGEWTPGTTVDVTTDGHTHPVAEQPAGPVPPQLPVLEAATAMQILQTLREAHTGTPPAAAPAVPVPLHTSRADTPPADTAPPPGTDRPADDVPTGRARLRVLGPPRIEGITGPGRPLRAKALELAVYLAVHPDGAATREIGEYLEPDARLSQADQRVHTNVSNLRHVLGRAGTADTKNAYVIKTAGRYRLDPTTVDVDVWTLRDLMRNATIATGPRRRELLTTACDLCAAPLAEGQDYEWLPPHRETIRRWGTEAHLLLADDLLHHDPQAASDLLDKAITLDHYNEALYVKAMHARYALGDADGIRTLLRALTKALIDLDTQPHDDTITLATQLRTSLSK
ncbi:transcriptional regulator [Micromonospora sp. HM134]|nr:transcriptional regulator [Micromonospora sp. HM134]